MTTVIVFVRAPHARCAAASRPSGRSRVVRMEGLLSLEGMAVSLAGEGGFEQLAQRDRREDEETDDRQRRRHSPEVASQAIEERRHRAGPPPERVEEPVGPRAAGGGPPPPVTGGGRTRGRRPPSRSASAPQTNFPTAPPAKTSASASPTPCTVEPLAISRKGRKVRNAVRGGLSMW